MFKKIWENKITIASISIIGVLVFSIITFWQQYSIQNELNFTKEDNVILFFLAIITFLLCGIVIYLIYDRYNTTKLLKTIAEDIANSEKNIIKFQNNTTSMILKHFGKIISKGVVDDEE